MEEAMEDKQGEPRYYSVTRPLKINGARRVPSVCYDLPKRDIEEMKKLADGGYVVLYSRKVRFQSGAVVPNDASTIVEAVSSSSASDNEFAPQT
jgi:hypothetical protein